MDNMQLRYDWSYLLELGYTSEELEEYEEDYADDILELLTDENLVETYQNNVRYLLNHLEKDEVFSLIAWNTSAIMLSSQTFASRMEQIAGALGENWAQLMYELYWESGEPLWDAVGYLRDSDWEDAFIKGTAEIEDTFYIIEDGELIGYSGQQAHVTIPKGVTWIGEAAFQNCEHLVSVIIPNSVDGVGMHAFSYCENLTSVVLPDTIAYIYNCAFEECRQLKEIVIPEHTEIDNGAFNKCDGLADKDGWIIINGICFDNVSDASDLLIPNNVNIISGGAFSDNNQLKTVIIPENVTEVHCWSFSRCRDLEKVIILNNSVELENYVFSDCDLEKLTIYTQPNSTAANFAINKGIMLSSDFTFLENNGSIDQSILASDV